MKRYTHDYTKAAKANEYMYAALHYARREDYTNCAAQILNARRLMDEYLASENMIADEDTAYGWYKTEEVEQIL